MDNICPQLTMKITQQSQWRHSDVFTVNFELISHLVLVSIADIEQVNPDWFATNWILIKTQVAITTEPNMIWT